MKNCLLIICLSILALPAFSQETKFVFKRSTELNNSYNEEYYVLKNNKKNKHGTYVKYREGYPVRILESGSYENGIKSGLWEYFHDASSAKNSIKEKGQYANGKKNGVWTYYYRDTVAATTSVQKFGKRKKIDSINIDINQQTLKLRLAGRYLNDKRIGEWISFDYEGKLYQQYDFYTSRLIMDLSIDDSLEYNRNRRALYIGGLPSFVDFWSNEFDFVKVSSQVEKDSTSVIISFKIDKNGYVSDSNVYKSNGSKVFEKEAIRIISSTNDFWIPALLNGEVVESEQKFEITIKRKIISPNGMGFNIRFVPILED